MQMPAQRERIAAAVLRQRQRRFDKTDNDAVSLQKTLAALRMRQRTAQDQILFRINHPLK